LQFILKLFQSFFKQTKLLTTMTDKSNMVPTTDFSKSSTKFHGTEGPQVAVLLQRHILMELGKRNEAHFLTTPRSKIIDEAMQRITGVTAQSSTDIINAEEISPRDF
jgi:hypothetical protein